MLAAIFVVVVRLRPQIAPDGPELSKIERFEAIDAARRTAAQIVGGIVVLLVGAATAYFTLRRVTALEQQVSIAEQGQITERFIRAIDQPGASENGAPKLEIRAGAIHSLERIATESPRDRRAILEILMAYLREHSPVKVLEGEGEAEPPTTDRVRMDVSAAIRALQIWPKNERQGPSGQGRFERLAGFPLVGRFFTLHVIA